MLDFGRRELDDVPGLTTQGPNREMAAIGRPACCINRCPRGWPATRTRVTPTGCAAIRRCAEWSATARSQAAPPQRARWAALRTWPGLSRPDKLLLTGTSDGR